MNEDERTLPVSLRADRYTESNTVWLYALVHRLDGLLAEARPADLAWRTAYRTNVSDFLEFFNATTPNLPCACDKKFGK